MADSPELNASGAVTLTISSDGAALDDTVEVISVSINKTINRIANAKIVLLDGDMPGQDFPLSNKDTLKPGAEIEIKAGYEQQQETIFKGIIVRHGIKITGNNYARLIIECRDKAVAMTIGRNNVNYVDSLDSDIITKLIGNYSGLSSDVESTSNQHKELVQYYCSDWDFMLSRAEVNGLLVINEDGKVSVKAPDTSSSAQLSVTYGEDLMEFHAQADALSQLTSTEAVSWDLTNQQVIKSTGQSPETLITQGDLDSTTLADVAAPDSYKLQTSAPKEKTVLDAWAKAQQLKSGLARLRGSMKFQGSAKAKTGTLIELKGVGNRFNGSAFISTVNHELFDGNWITEVEFGMSPKWFAENRDLVAPPASGLLPGVEGLQVGTVKQLDQDPEGQYKIQVSVPVLEADTEGVWARLAGFYASEQFGAFFIPEIGDEVILGYVNNDPSHPVILGSLYSSKRTAPYELTADNFTKAIVTKSLLKMEFDDEKKILTIITPENNQIVLSDEDKSILIQDQNDNKVTMSSDGISLESCKDITLTAKGKVSIDAVDNIAMKSNADVTVDGLNITHTANVGFTAKGSASAELSASGQTTVKGAMVMIN